jgi:hypothetical protein
MPLQLETQRLKRMRVESKEVETRHCQYELAQKAAKLKNKEICKDAKLINQKLTRLEARCNPPYLTFLPESILINVISRLSIKDAISCFKTCKRLRATTFAILQWKPTMYRPPTLALQSANNPSDLINKLPVEVLSHIFHYLDTGNLLFCQDTCKWWRSIIQKESSKCFKEVDLFGDLKMINSQWTKVLRLTGGNTPKSLSIYYHNMLARYRCEIGWDEVDNRTWSDFAISKTFPHSTLESFSYQADESSAVDQEMWNTLQDCSHLKVLQYYQGVDMDMNMFMYKEESYNFSVCSKSNLAKCRLEEISLSSLDDHGPLYYNSEIRNILSKAKTISIIYHCSNDDLYDLLGSAKDTVENLSLQFETDTREYENESSASDDDDNFEGGFYYGGEILLPRLTSFSGYLPSPLKIEAPELKVLDLTVRKTSDLDILKACGHSLEVFKCSFEGPDPKHSSFLDELLAALLHLPSCHTLTLNLSGSYNHHTQTDYENLRRFWIGLFSDMKLLPSLKTLTLKDSYLKHTVCSLPTEKLFSWLQDRKKAGRTMEKLILVDYQDLSILAVFKLMQVVNQLTYRQR